MNRIIPFTFSKALPPNPPKAQRSSVLEGCIILFKKTEQVYKIHINACNSTLSLAGQITATCSVHAKSLFFAQSYSFRH